LKKKKEFFFEKKNQKTFVPGARGKIRAMAGELGVRRKIKVFWFFSSEKNILSSG
jgi:hypothetical protein